MLSFNPVGDKLRRPRHRRKAPFHAVEHGVVGLAFLETSLAISGFVLMLVLSKAGNHPGRRASRWRCSSTSFGWGTRACSEIGLYTCRGPRS